MSGFTQGGINPATGLIRAQIVPRYFVPYGGRNVSGNDALWVGQPDQSGRYIALDSVLVDVGDTAIQMPLPPDTSAAGGFYQSIQFPAIYGYLDNATWPTMLSHVGNFIDNGRGGLLITASNQVFSYVFRSGSDSILQVPGEGYMSILDYNAGAVTALYPVAWDNIAGLWRDISPYGIATSFNIKNPYRFRWHFRTLVAPSYFSDYDIITDTGTQYGSPFSQYFYTSPNYVSGLFTAFFPGDSVNVSGSINKGEGYGPSLESIAVLSPNYPDNTPYNALQYGSGGGYGGPWDFFLHQGLGCCIGCQLDASGKKTYYNFSNTSDTGTTYQTPLAGSTSETFKPERLPESAQIILNKIACAISKIGSDSQMFNNSAPYGPFGARYMGPCGLTVIVSKMRNGDYVISTFFRPNIAAGGTLGMQPLVGSNNQQYFPLNNTPVPYADGEFQIGRDQDYGFQFHNGSGQYTFDKPFNRPYFAICKQNGTYNEFTPEFIATSGYSATGSLSLDNFPYQLYAFFASPKYGRIFATALTADGNWAICEVGFFLHLFQPALNYNMID